MLTFALSFVPWLEPTPEGVAKLLGLIVYLAVCIFVILTGYNDSKILGSIFAATLVLSLYLWLPAYAVAPAILFPLGIVFAYAGGLFVNDVFAKGAWPDKSLGYVFTSARKRHIFLLEIMVAAVAAFYGKWDGEQNRALYSGRAKGGYHGQP